MSTTTTVLPNRLKAGATFSASSLDFADLLRLGVTGLLDSSQQIELGQFFTGASVARLMAGMFDLRCPPATLQLLDAGAGVGSLTAAFVAEICGRDKRPESIEVTAYETDGELLSYLKETLAACGVQCERAGVGFSSYVVHDDFIEAGVDLLQGGLFGSEPQFNCAILNPPYRKLRTDSDARRLLSSVGIETTNLYSAFLWLAMRLLQPGGEMVAITPRSFCNGPYFKAFRVAFQETMSFRHLHMFESRVDAFRDNDILQENVIFHATRKTGMASPVENETVIVSSSLGPEDEDDATHRVVPASQIIRPGDRDVFINLVADEWGQSVANQMDSLSASLKDLRITVSTGRVVDFRSREHLRASAVPAAGEILAPLIYPLHFGEMFISWPREGSRKANALAVNAETQSLLNPAGYYVLVKRFTSKEQARRVVATVYDPEQIRQPGASWDRQLPYVAFENHLNYFHADGAGLSLELALGLAGYLNSTVVDTVFRQFNGHTQVNATDLRSLKYPSRVALEHLGRHLLEVYPDTAPTQADLDTLVRQELLPMADGENAVDPIQSKARIDEAIQILKDLQLDRKQQNERSALTLLALLNLTPEKKWKEAEKPLCGITPMMEFFREHYGKNYAPNSRETVRRQTVHQFLQAGLIAYNPDDPQRPINSGKTVYQITPEALALVQAFGTRTWTAKLRAFKVNQAAIVQRAVQERTLNRIPVTTPTGETFILSPGGQNHLIKEIVQEFCPRYTPGGQVLYVGDADEKWAVHDQATLAALGVVVDEHGKMPDVVVYYSEKNWLVLIEAVTSHGPVDAKRHLELKELFEFSTAGLVFATAFEDRATMGRYLRDIAWETEVWVADAPDHLIHFNGERFLGPYGQEAQ